MFTTTGKFEDRDLFINVSRCRIQEGISLELQCNQTYVAVRCGVNLARGRVGSHDARCAFSETALLCL